MSMSYWKLATGEDFTFPYCIITKSFVVHLQYTHLFKIIIIINDNYNHRINLAFPRWEYINSPGLHDNYITRVLIGSILQMRKLRSHVQSHTLLKDVGYLNTRWSNSPPTVCTHLSSSSLGSKAQNKVGARARYGRRTTLVSVSIPAETQEFGTDLTENPIPSVVVYTVLSMSVFLLVDICNVDLPATACVLNVYARSWVRTSSLTFKEMTNEIRERSMASCARRLARAFFLIHRKSLETKKLDVFKITQL